MGSTLWHTLPIEKPDVEEVVWIRRFWWVAPWLATWDASATTFTASNGLVIPWYEVWRWKHVVEP